MRHPRTALPFIVPPEPSACAARFGLLSCVFLAAAHAGVILTPLDPAKVDDTSATIDGGAPAVIDFVNRSSGAVDIYWIDRKGDRVLYSKGLAAGATYSVRTGLNNPWLVVASGTGGTTAQDTGTRLAGFEAVTPNGTLDPAIRDTAIVTSPDAATAMGYGLDEKAIEAVRAPPVDHSRIRTMVNATDGQKYVWIPPGAFTMGCSPGDTECAGDEKPPHAERIANGFWLGQTEVTQAAYQRVTGGNPSTHKGDQLPVDSLTWNHAVNYCTAIGGRLPTEKEWEYAARAGIAWARYGNLDEVAWYRGNSGDSNQPVARKQPNAFGLYDMLGNVWEWMEDSYGDTGSKVVRGGSRSADSRFARSSFRMKIEPSLRNDDKGFRCAGEWPAPEKTPPGGRAGTAPSEEIFLKLTIDMLTGSYRRDPLQNDWHHGTIAKDPLRWTNDAGKSWRLTPDLSHGVLLTGPDNPYYNTEPGRVFQIILRDGPDGGYLPAVGGFQFNGEFYRRLDSRRARSRSPSWLHHAR